MQNSVFIHIDIENGALSPSLNHQIEDVCPVNIYAIAEDKLVVRPEQVDECTLCELCLRLAPAGAIRIHKLYSGEVLVAISNIAS
jgi:NAD-dependent dihydropyrimidine dehydrogenase PreA subunit